MHQKNIILGRHHFRTYMRTFLNYRKYTSCTCNMVAHFRGDVHPLSGPAQELTFSCLCSTMSKVRTHSHLRKRWLIQCFVFKTMYLIQCFNTVFNTACVLFLLLLHGTILLTGEVDHRLTEALVLCETQSLATSQGDSWVWVY